MDAYIDFMAGNGGNMDRRHFIAAALATPIIAAFPSLANAKPEILPDLELKIIHKMQWEGGYHTVIVRMHELRRGDCFYFENDPNTLWVACCNGSIGITGGKTKEVDGKVYYVPEGEGAIRADDYATWNEKRQAWDYKGYRKWNAKRKEWDYYKEQQ